jgi:hypothetical protein
MLENDYDDYDNYYDYVRDPDYEGDKESDVDMYESNEEEEGGNLDVVRRQEQPREEIRVYMDPPIERADGDNDKGSGEKKIKQYCGSVADPEPLIWILIFLPIRILDPGSSTLLVTVWW